MSQVRERKKREMRERISDVATALFFARGFEAVTVDEIAAEAGVSKVTVFNYFPRKEDLHVDRAEEVKRVLCEAVATRSAGESPIEALSRLAHRLHADKQSYAWLDDRSVGWWRVVAASPSLQSRVRELGDEAVEALAIELAGPEPEGRARLVAGMVILTWRTAYAEGYRAFDRGASAKKASAIFLARLDQGFAAVKTLGP